jgi:hypothetical protein
VDVSDLYIPTCAYWGCAALASPTQTVASGAAGDRGRLLTLLASLTSGCRGFESLTAHQPDDSAVTGAALSSLRLLAAGKHRGLRQGTRGSGSELGQAPAGIVEQFVARCGSCAAGSPQPS